MSKLDFREILESLLCDLKDALNEPHASDWSKVFMPNHLRIVFWE